MKYFYKRSAVIIAMILFLTAYSAYATQHEVASQVLRLHIIANSDSDSDQSLKLAVRDSLLKKSGTLFSGKTTDEAIQAANENLSYIQQLCSQVVKENGYDYAVCAQVCEDYFPTKQYDGFALPAGEYKALKIIIGDGKGKNWWCVMFPPLCVGQASKMEDICVKSGLDSDAIAIMNSENTGGEVEVRFKLAELFGESKQYLSTLFN